MSMSKLDDTNVSKADEGLSNQLATLSASKSNKNRKIFIMRHGERVDFAVENWTAHCFDEFKNYVRKDLNMPKSLPKRKNSPVDWKTDTPLTHVGMYVAKLTGEGLLDAGVKIDHAFSSPAFRSIQTCTSALEGLNLKNSVKVKVEPGLYEWLTWYPFVPGFLDNDELLQAHYNIDPDYKPFISVEQLKTLLKENAQGVYNRNHEVLKHILATTEGNILIVGHSVTLDSCTRQLTGKPLRTKDEGLQVIQHIPYCALVMVEQIDGVWKMKEPDCMPVTHTKNARFDWTALIAT